jgi:indole-3-glycerol phosphate synthase
MSGILDQIIAYKKAEVARNKAECPVRYLEHSELFTRKPASLSAGIKQPGSTGIIAEFKRKSPSKGVLNAGADVAQTSVGYVQAGAAALSILTDNHFFGGSADDLGAARKLNACPILRKDFIVDEYQILEARAMGADAVLLIAAALEPRQAAALASLAHRLDMEVLLELHNENEWHNHAHIGADVVGVNNRNLNSFEVSMETSHRLAALLPPHITRISESGIDSVEAIRQLKQAGYHGFLIGEHFMKHPQPEVAAAAWVNQLRALPQ